MPAAEHCTRCGTELTHGSAPDGLCPACLLSGALESDPAGTHEHLIGRRIAHYQILDELGRGGMGEVYRARDTTLKRTVAIKVLPESVADDAERLARFQREAEVLAALNHPNIAAIYGLEKAEGTTALVMELVEGPTLADRIAKGPLPVDEALAIAKSLQGNNCLYCWSASSTLRPWSWPPCGQSMQRWRPCSRSDRAGCGRRLRPRRSVMAARRWSPEPRVSRHRPSSAVCVN